MFRIHHPTLLRYSAAAAAVAVAVLLRLLLMPVLGLHLPLLLLWPAVLFAAWYGGLRPGLVATLLSALVVALWLFRPDEKFILADRTDLTGLVLFILLGSVLCILTEGLHRANCRVERLLAGERAARAEAEAAHKQVTDILESITDGFVALDRDWRFTYVNPEAERLTGLPRGQMLGRSYWEVFPDARGTRVEAEFRRAVAEQVPVEFENYHESWGTWFDTNAYPARDGGLTFYFRDITSRKRLEEELRCRNEQLQEANRHKDSFLAVLGHELRNTLTPLRNAFEVLGLREKDPSAVGWAREMGQRQVGIMARLVDDLLDVSRVARGQVRLQRGRLDLAALVRAAAEDHRLALEEGRLTLDLSLPDGPVWVLGDAPRLAQIVGNLLTNAGKFTDAGGRVTVRLEVDPQRRRAVLRVRDTGIGIEPALLDKVFDSFCQAERSVGRSRGGLGLGLALVRGLAELHAGGVGASSAGPGQGSEFTVWLPLLPETTSPPPAPAVPRAKEKRLKILLIDDSHDTADSMRRLFELMGGYDVTVAYAGAAGVELARGSRPDVIVCDLNLPDGDGFEVARAVRNDPALAATRLVAMSGYSGDEDRQRCREAGFDLALTKPVDPTELIQLLAK